LRTRVKRTVVPWIYRADLSDNNFINTTRRWKTMPTEAGQVDDNAADRAKKNKKDKEKQLKDIFSDNTTGRYGTENYEKA